jgi:hypothetical protein
MSSVDQGVTIGLREIYDKVTQTHEAVQQLSPRLATVEKNAEQALRVATDADVRSKENRRQLNIRWKVLGR